MPGDREDIQAALDQAHQTIALYCDSLEELRAAFAADRGGDRDVRALPGYAKQALDANRRLNAHIQKLLRRLEGDTQK